MRGRHRHRARRMTRQEILPKVERDGCTGKERERGMGKE